MGVTHPLVADKPSSCKWFSTRTYCYSIKGSTAIALGKSLVLGSEVGPEIFLLFWILG